jgi:hypothetical protein
MSYITYTFIHDTYRNIKRARIGVMTGDIDKDVNVNEKLGGCIEDWLPFVDSLHSRNLLLGAKQK